ncbi:MAG: hypothetical protein U5K69_18735 [Balneolaceae bacterium]|nr:hypothetical protein [Balneolaceae bacterium]
MGYILEKLTEYWGGNVSWELNTAEEPHEANTLMLDSSKVRQRLDWTPKLGLDDSLKLVTDWYKNYYDGSDMIKFTKNQISEYENLLKEK